MSTVSIVLITSVVVAFLVILVLKYGLKWVNVDKIPQDALEHAAKNLLKGKFDEAEKEIEEMQEREENKLREKRKENTEHEEILMEREKQINKRSKNLDEKSENLETREEFFEELSKRY